MNASHEYKKYKKYKLKYLQLKYSQLNNQNGGKDRMNRNNRNNKNNKNNIELEYVGEFEVESGKIIVSDPSYEFKDEKTGFELNTVIPVNNGKWEVYIKKFPQDKTRINELIIFNGDNNDNDVDNVDNVDDIINIINTNNNWIKIAMIGVDSGQAGFFDLKHFRKDSDVKTTDIIPSYVTVDDKGDKWYAMCCGKTYNEKTKEYDLGIISYGVVSSSGYGNEYYGLYSIKYNNKVIGLKMIFY